MDLFGIFFDVFRAKMGCRYRLIALSSAVLLDIISLGFRLVLLERYWGNSLLFGEDIGLPSMLLKNMVSIFSTGMAWVSFHDFTFWGLLTPTSHSLGSPKVGRLWLFFVYFFFEMVFEFIGYILAYFFLTASSDYFLFMERHSIFGALVAGGRKGKNVWFFVILDLDVVLLLIAMPWIWKYRDSALKKLTHLIKWDKYYWLHNGLFFMFIATVKIPFLYFTTTKANLPYVEWMLRSILIFLFLWSHLNQDVMGVWLSAYWGMS